MHFDVRWFEGSIRHSGLNKINELVVSWYFWTGVNKSEPTIVL